MLRDATYFTFMGLAREAGIVKHERRSEMTVELVNGVQVLFRSSDDPDRLRGPNLGWFYADEIALMDEDIWPILIGRLREAPGRGWGTTTPRGYNWTYNRFVRDATPDYAVIKASTESNTFLPPGFIGSLRQSYTASWQRQEIDGEWIEQQGPLFQRHWFKTVGGAPSGLRWVRYYDLAASTRETASRTATAAAALADDGTLYIRDVVADRIEWPDQARLIRRLMRAERDTMHGVEKALHGLAAVQELMRDETLAGIHLTAVNVHKDKVSRALPWAARAEQGKVALVDGPWVPEWLEEIVAFDGSSKTYSDRVDAVSGCVQLLGSTGPACGSALPTPPPRNYGGRMRPKRRLRR
jgi:predicted phage terminase large subunit-like protein